MNSWKAKRPPACDPPFRTFWTEDFSKSYTTLQNQVSLTGNGEDVRLLGASQVGNVCVERDTLFSSCSLCDGHRYAEDGICAQLFLVLCAIKLVQEGIDSGLVLDIDLLLDESRRNGVVDIGDSLGDALTAPL
tara:strand:+ start:3190 stop:3588 length:399 start_codon:yes stop_codon:yes gene_type:complete